MRTLDQIESEADFIHESSNTNFSHAERKLASLISDLANHLEDITSTLDDVVSLQLDAAGIDMKPAYERLRKMIEERTK
jgi:hypothetical protein